MSLWENTSTCLCPPNRSKVWRQAPSSTRGQILPGSQFQVQEEKEKFLFFAFQEEEMKYLKYACTSLLSLAVNVFPPSHMQLVKWTSLRSAAPSWRPPSRQQRWSPEAPSSTRGLRPGEPSRLLPPPPVRPRLLRACPLSVPWPSPPPALLTRRPCTNAYLRPAVVTLHQAATQFQTTSLHSGQLYLVQSRYIM